ncbi:MAG: hypothetical protein HY354_04025 [Planctomycetes bacterium]|nr:hypothetical protein [Planctomycetota bacterium]
MNGSKMRIKEVFLVTFPRHADMAWRNPHSAGEGKWQIIRRYLVVLEEKY